LEVLDFGFFVGDLIGVGLSILAQITRSWTPTPRADSKSLIVFLAFLVQKLWPENKLKIDNYLIICLGIN